MSEVEDPRTRAAAGFYEPLAASASAAHRVGWESPHAHRARLRAILAALGPLDEISSVLDAGCGEGALAGLLAEAGFRGTYRGEDVLPRMIERASASYPEQTFVVADAFDPDGPPADAVVSSGSLNTTGADDHDAEVEAALEALWARARRVLVVDLSVADRHPGGAGLARADLGRAWRTARRLSRVVTVREDLIPGEALLILWRDRRARLEALLPGRRQAHERAEILLASGEPAAAQATLRGVGGSQAALFRAMASAALGRIRDAERSLRVLLGDPSVDTRAALFLAMLLRATRREAEARRFLELLARAPDPVADEARSALADGAESLADAAAWAEAIEDPWIRREALAALAKRRAADTEAAEMEADAPDAAAEPDAAAKAQADAPDAATEAGAATKAATEGDANAEGLPGGD